MYFIKYRFNNYLFKTQSLLRIKIKDIAKTNIILLQQVKERQSLLNKYPTPKHTFYISYLMSAI